MKRSGVFTTELLSLTYVVAPSSLPSPPLPSPPPPTGPTLYCIYKGLTSAEDGSCVHLLRNIWFLYSPHWLVTWISQKMTVFIASSLFANPPHSLYSTSPPPHLFPSSPSPPSPSSLPFSSPPSSSPSPPSPLQTPCLITEIPLMPPPPRSIGLMSS